MLGLKLIHVSKRSPRWAPVNKWNLHWKVYNSHWNIFQVAFPRSIVPFTIVCAMGLVSLRPRSRLCVRRSAWNGRIVSVLISWRMTPPGGIHTAGFTWTRSLWYQLTIPIIMPNWAERVGTLYRAHTAGGSYDDIIKWKLFPRHWPFVRGIHRSPVNSPHKGQWRGALMFSVICA